MRRLSAVRGAVRRCVARLTHRRTWQHRSMRPTRSGWRGRMNQFQPEKNRVAVSSIFKWFKEDFDAAGGVPKILGMYAPPPMRAFVSKPGYKIEYLPYRWG